AAGNGITQDRSRSRRFSEQACLLGEQANCHVPGEAYLKGKDGAPYDLARARRFLDRGCQGNGSAISCCALATTYASEDPMDESRAATLFEKACSLGHGEACIHFYQGKPDVSPEVRTALRQFGESCSVPFPAIGCSGGACELNDVGPQQRRAVALRRLGGYCEEGHYEACLVLGLLTPLSEKSAAFLDRACSHDLAAACHRLAYDAA